MKRFWKVMQKVLIGLMVFVLVFTSFGSSVDSVSAHRRGTTHSRKHKVRHRANGHAKKSHRATRKAKRHVAKRKAPKRRKVAYNKKHKAAPKKHKAAKKKASHKKKRSPKKKKASHKKKSSKKKKAYKKSKKSPKKHKSSNKKKSSKKKKAYKKSKKSSKKHKSAHKKKKSSKKQKTHKKSKKSSKKHKSAHKKKQSSKKKKSHKKKSSKKHKAVKKHKSSKKKKSSKNHKASGSAVIAILSRKTGISKSVIAFVTDLIGYNDAYTMITGKDAETGKPRSRWIGAAWTAFNFIPISKVTKFAKVAKLLATAKKSEKVVKDGNRIRKASAAAKLAIKRAAEKKAKRKAEKAADRYANKAAKRLNKAAKKNKKTLKKAKKAKSKVTKKAKRTKGERASATNSVSTAKPKQEITKVTRPDSNKLHHIFDKKGHGLDVMVKKHFHGSQSDAYMEMQRIAQNYTDRTSMKRGVQTDVDFNIKGYPVTIRIYVTPNGKANIGTAFIKGANK